MAKSVTHQMGMINVCCRENKNTPDRDGAGRLLAVGKLLFKNMAFSGYHDIFAAEKEVEATVEVDVGDPRGL